MRSRSLYSFGICVLWLALALSAQQPSTDYTQWRGQAGDGSASAFTEPRAWPETLTQGWRADVVSYLSSLKGSS